MRLKFRHKVFLTFLLNSLVIVICMLFIGRYYSTRNFEEYVGKVETERLSELAEALSQEYRMSGEWSSVLNNLGHRLELRGIGPGQPPRAAIAGEPLFFPPPAPPPGPPPDPHAGSAPQEGEFPPFGDPPPPPHGPPPFHRPMPPRISLFDAAKQPLIGTELPSEDGFELKAIQMDGQTIGWLGLRKHQPPTHPLDVEFLRLQSRMFYSIGGVALLLAVLVTLALSRHLLAPVKELAEGTRALTSRRFETRIEVRSRDELGQLASDFNNMAQTLERYEQMRRQWLADISHELRTPLAILRGEIEAMQDGVRQVSREALDSLHFEVMHVGRIVHDLHDLSLIESPTASYEKTALDPRSSLEEALRSFHTRFEQRGIRIETDEGGAGKVAIMADPDRLKQLYSNLLENTLRYAHAPGSLRIIQESAPGHLILHFEDSGPGAPEESLGRLFDRLYRVDKARSRAEGGSGLGLAICKSIVESFGGRIEASNVPAGGLRISITFPVLSD